MMDKKQLGKLRERVRRDHVKWKNASKEEVLKRLADIERRQNAAANKGCSRSIRRLLELDILWLVEQVEIRL